MSRGRKRFLTGQKRKLVCIKRPARFVEAHGGLPSANLAYQDRWALSVYGTKENLPLPEPPIDGGIEDHDHEAQNRLNFSRESFRIEDREIGRASCRERG